MLGTCNTTVEVKYSEQCTHLTVHVVDGKRPNLLGKDWLNRLTINQSADIDTSSKLVGQTCFAQGAVETETGKLKQLNIEAHVH